MKRALLEWEYEQYRRRKTRNQRKRRKMRYAVLLATTVAAAAIAAILAAEARAEQEEDNSPPPEIVAQEPLKIELLPTVAETVERVEMPEMSYEEARAVLLERMPKMEETILTHYCICQKCCGKTPEHPAYGITASGRKAEPYTSVAVDPKIIPLGSTVYIDHGDGDIRVYRADDTGRDIKGAHIDLCVTEHGEAKELGVDTVTVWWEV